MSLWNPLNKPFWCFHFLSFHKLPKSNASRAFPWIFSFLEFYPEKPYLVQIFSIFILSLLGWYSWNWLLASSFQWFALFIRSSNIKLITRLPIRIFNSIFIAPLPQFHFFFLLEFENLRSKGSKYSKWLGSSTKFYGLQ